MKERPEIYKERQNIYEWARKRTFTGSEAWVPVMMAHAELEDCTDLLNKQHLESYKTADDAMKAALTSIYDVALRIKAFQAFAHCYEDLELDDRASEMTSKWQAIIQEHWEP